MAREDKPLDGYGLFGVVKEVGVDDEGMPFFICLFHILSLLSSIRAEHNYFVIICLHLSINKAWLNSIQTFSHTRFIVTKSKSHWQVEN